MPLGDPWSKLLGRVRALELWRAAFESIVGDLIGVHEQTLKAEGAVELNAKNVATVRVLLEADATGASIVNAPSYNGDRLTIQWIQDAIGKREYVWPPNVRLTSESSPTETAHAIDSVTFEWDGALWIEVARAIGVVP